MAMRVELPDEPYTLGRLATALGSLGANIIDIDVHELDGANVVDEIVITGPASLSPDAVRRALIDAGARSVVSVPMANRHMDALARVLTSLVNFVREPRSDESLLSAITSIVSVEAADIVSIGDLQQVDPGGRQLSCGTPAARTLDGSWVLAVPRCDGVAPPRDALVVRRALRFSATEIARLRALLLLHSHLEAPKDVVR